MIGKPDTAARGFLIRRSSPRSDNNERLTIAGSIAILASD
jgi:hypothetical protein